MSRLLAFQYGKHLHPHTRHIHSTYAYPISHSLLSRPAHFHTLSRFRPSFSPTLILHRTFCSSSPSNKPQQTDPDSPPTTGNTTPTANEPASTLTSTASSAATATPSTLTREHLQRAFRRWTTWFAIRTMTLIAIAVSIVWYCWDHPNEVINLKNRLSQIFSELGTSTLNQKELQMQATEYSKQMIKDVFNDASMQQETKKFFVQILSQQDFLDTILVLLRDLFARDAMIESVKQLVIDVFNDESVIEQCKILVGHAISAEENKQLLLKTLNEILDDEQLTDHARNVANQTVKGVLDDEEIRKLSTMFLQHVLNDDAVQQSSSDTLYKILVDAFTPGIFKKKGKTANEEMKHVPFQHIDVESMEQEANINESETEQDGESSDGDEVRQQMNHIDSVIGNHPS